MGRLQELLREAGVFQYGVVSTDEVDFLPEVRAMCEANTCRRYGAAWGCPPAVGTVEECRARLGQYEKLVVFTVKQDLEDSFDAEGMAAGGKRLLEACNAIDDGLWEAFGGQYQVLASGGCVRCEDCTYPHAPCRCPEKAHHSLAAYGILVSKLARQAGVKYNNGANTVTYFGAVACHPGLLEA